MIHLTEAIVGIKNKPKQIGKNKRLCDLVVGDTIYHKTKSMKSVNDFKITEISNNTHFTDGTGKHTIANFDKDFNKKVGDAFYTILYGSWDSDVVAFGNNEIFNGVQTQLYWIYSTTKEGAERALNEIK